MRKCIPLFASVLTALLASVAALVALPVGPAQGAVTLGQGFAQSPVVGGLTAPTDMEFAPDGRLFVTEQAGRLRVAKPDGTLATFLDISAKVDSTGDRGLMALAFDPGFATNRYVYLYYTKKATATVPAHNRVVRVTANGDMAVAGSERLIFRLNNQDNIHHMGGAMDFAKDGKLYISTGDNVGGPTQTLNNLLGKMLRINKDGTIPTTNPFYSTTSGGNRAIWALGLRNPFKFAVKPGTNTIFINDVGADAWEEINLGASGANYGWNVYEGPETDPQYADPIFAYEHGGTDTTGCSITGGAFYNSATVQFPSGYVGDYFFADFCNGWISRYDPASDTATGFATGLSSVVDLEVSKDGELYYLSRGSTASVSKIRYAGSANRPPNSAVSASPASGALPLAVDFDGSGSVDPDAGDTLSYLWDFGDGSPTETTFTPTTSHTYSTKGTYTASLRVRDNHGAISDPATVRIDAGNEAPDLAIGSPSADLLFRVEQQITLSGSATDLEDGALPGSSFDWEVLRHHNGTHTHPYFSGTGNNLSITAPPPEALSATGAGNYLEIRFTATDSEGLSETVIREVQPNRVGVSFGSNPSGLSLQVDGEAFAAPRTLVSWEGYELLVNGPYPQTLSETTYVFSSWSDGKEQQHGIVTGAAPSTYTASFKACTKTGTPGDDVLDGTSSADVICGMGGNDELKGLGGNDTIEGIGGNDTLRGGGGADKVIGGGGADSLYGEDGNDALHSRDGVNANDTLDGGPGTDTKVTDATEKSMVGFP